MVKFQLLVAGLSYHVNISIYHATSLTTFGLMDAKKPWKKKSKKIEREGGDQYSYSVYDRSKHKDSKLVF